MPLKTAKQVREEFELRGTSISQWAIRNGYSPALVYRVLSNDQLPKRGKSHDIAVVLRLKNGFVSTEETENSSA